MPDPVVVLIEDEPQIRRFLRATLTAQGYRLFEATTGADGLVEVGSRQPDVVIVDLGLPDVDGIDVIRRLREWTAVPIIVLSAREQESEKVAALDAGADDYVTKPFGMGELLARVRASERRQAVPSEEERAIVETDDFTVDLAAKKVVASDGSAVRLTPTEWHLVEILVRNPGKLVSQRQLLHEVWGPRYEEETNYLRVYMAQIRRKLEPDPAAPKHFITEPGMGYRFEPGA